MKSITSILVLSPIALSVVCTSLILLNNVILILPTWLLWEIILVTTMLTLFVALSLVSVVFLLWLKLQYKKRIRHQDFFEKMTPRFV